MYDPHGPVNSAGRRAGPCEGVCKLCDYGDGVNALPAPVPSLKVFPNATALHSCGAASSECIATRGTTCGEQPSYRSDSGTQAQALWGRAYALRVPDVNVTYASGFAISARVQQPWARTNSSAVSGLFSLRVGNEPTSGRADAPLQAWAYRSAAGMHAAVQLGGVAAQRIQLPPCAPGVWATLALSVSPAAGALRAEVACDGESGTFVATSGFVVDAWPTGAAFTAGAQLWLGLYGVKNELMGHVVDLPMRGDNLAGFALYGQALAQSEMRSAMHDLLQPARFGVGGSAMCSAARGDGCAPCAACQRATAQALGTSASI